MTKTAIQMRRGVPRSRRGYTSGVTGVQGSHLEAPRKSDWGAVLTNELRGLTGGMVLGIPVLFTMEAWWVGRAAAPWQALVALAVAAVPVFLLSRTAGFHGSKTTSLSDAFLDTVEALALALVACAGVLLLLRVITLDTPPFEALGKVVIESVPFAIGVVVADHFVDKPGRSEAPDKQAPEREGPLRATLTDQGAVAVGAGVLALAIAPTDEVPMLLAEATPWSLLALMAVSLVLSYALTFVAGFSNQEKRRKQPGLLQRPLTESVVAYLVALLAAAAMLWFFDNLALDAPLHESLGRVIILGLPAAVGGALGRMVV